MVELGKDDFIDSIHFLSSEEEDLEPEIENIEFAVTNKIDVEIDANENDNIDDTLNELIHPTTSKGRERKLNQSLWKTNIAKLQRAKCEKYISLRNKPVKKRVTGPYCKCRRKCFNKFTNQDKLTILNTFNNIGEEQKQDVFLGGLIQVKNIN